jgi:hypothetical protein
MSRLPQLSIFKHLLKFFVLLLLLFLLLPFFFLKILHEVITDSVVLTRGFEIV